MAMQPLLWSSVKGSRSGVNAALAALVTAALLAWVQEMAAGALAILSGRVKLQSA